MRESGTITDYALFGALAQIRYTEPVATLDADVLVGLPDDKRIDALADIYKFCEQKGFLPEGEAIRIGACPVQFIPVFNRLSDAAMKQADTADFDALPFRVVQPPHLAS